MLRSVKLDKLSKKHDIKHTYSVRYKNFYNFVLYMQII